MEKVPKKNRILEKIKKEINLKIDYLKDDRQIKDNVATWASWNWGLGDNPHEVSATNHKVFELLQKELNNGYNEALDLGCG